MVRANRAHCSNDNWENTQEKWKESMEMALPQRKNFECRALYSVGNTLLLYWIELHSQLS